MKHFSLKTLFLVITIIAIVVWWGDSDFHVVHDESNPSHGRFVIYAKQGGGRGQLQVRVKHFPTNSNSQEIHCSGVMNVVIDESANLEFDSVFEKSTGVWCLYDTCNANFVILALPSKGQPSDFGNFWHPGIHIGWGRGFWAKCFNRLKTKHDIPYPQLPSEKRIEAG